MDFDMIKKNYDRGLWNSLMVKVAVVKQIITEAQYFTITGEVYTA